jgi:hypothetical protein
MFIDEKNKFVNPVVEVKKPEPFSLESLIAWLENQEAAETYCFTLTRECIWAKYTFALGGTIQFSPHRYQIGGHSLEVGPLDRSWREAVAVGLPKTFGGALKRARAYRSAL